MDEEPKEAATPDFLVCKNCGAKMAPKYVSKVVIRLRRMPRSCPRCLLKIVQNVLDGKPEG